MNILCIIHELARNGAVVCLLDAVRHFRDQGHNVTIFIDGPEPSRQDSLRPDFENAGAKVVLRPDGEPYDLALVCTLLNYRWVNRLKGQLPLAWWIHEGIAVTTSMLGKAGLREAIAEADHLLFPSPNADKMFEPIFGKIPSARRSIVPPIISRPALAAPAPKSPERFRIVCVGTLCARKKQSDLLAAAATLADLPIECVLIGENVGTDAELADRIAAGGDRVVATGGLGVELIHSYYNSADIFCLPSSDEHFPMAPLEAGLHRLPVVLSSLQCYDGVWVHGQNTLLHPIGDQLLLAAYLRTLFTTPELRVRLGQAAEKNALAFTKNRFSMALDLAIDATLASGGAPKKGKDERSAGLRRLFGWTKREPPVRGRAPPVEIPLIEPKAQAKPAGSEVLPPPSAQIGQLHDQAMARATTGDLTGAADLLHQALSKAPEDLRCLSSATMVLTFLKDYRQAEEIGWRAIEKGPRVPALHVNLGNCLFEQGRIKEALSSFGRALELRPDLTAALLNAGHCQVALGQHEEAARYFAAAHDTAFADPAVLASLGRAYLGIDHLSEAEDCLSRALAIDSSLLEASIDLERLRAVKLSEQIALQPAEGKKSLVFSLQPAAKRGGSAADRHAVGIAGSENAPNAEAVEILRWQPAGRKFLVCVRAGHQSLHRDWFKDAEPRNWDLLIHYYAVPPEGPDLRAEMVAAGGLSKFHAAKDLWRKEPSLLSLYDAVIFLDDDIACAQQDMNKAFDLFSRYGLKLAQPSLSHQSDDAWSITYRCPSFLVRFTNFVEIMMPIFSRDALSQCLDSFADSVSGYGLDFVWPRLIERTSSQVGIIDAIAFTHTKPVDFVNGAFYKYLRSIGVDPHREMQDVLRKYSITNPKTVITGVVMNEQINDGRSIIIA